MHWRHEFPFLFRPFGQSDKAHPDNYFSLVDQDWRSPLAQNSYRVWNTRLSRLDPVSFVDLVRRAAPYVSKREIATGRHWTGLFEILNEAKGFTHLLDLGYDDVGFIPPASCYTPDL